MRAPEANRRGRPYPRRQFIGVAVATAGATLVGCQSAPGRPASGPSPTARVVDTHTHFYDPTRPAGVPWPPPDDPVLYRRVLPPDYRALPGAETVVGTVVVEASPWLEDNQWILDLAAAHPFIVGFVGNLPVGTPAFAGLLRRFAANPVFRGVRLQEPRLAAGLDDASFVGDLRNLMEAGLLLDVVGGPNLLPAVARLAVKLPDLRIVIDHLAGLRIDGQEPPAAWCRDMEQAARCPAVFGKVSGLVEGTGARGGQAPTDAAFYRPVLDFMTRTFGDRRLIYGSNWPVCEHFASLTTVRRLVADYFASLGSESLSRVMVENSRAAYRWRAAAN